MNTMGISDFNVLIVLFLPLLTTNSEMPMDL